MRKIACLIAYAGLLVAGCTQKIETAPLPAPPSSASADKGDAILANAATAAAIADALQVAPPATVGQRTTIDEKAVRIAFAAADSTATIIDGLVVNGIIVRNSAVARELKAAILRTRSGLIAASAAQRAGSATSYQAALVKTREAVQAISSALNR